MMYLGGIFATVNDLEHGNVISNISKIPFKNSSWIVPRVTIEEYGNVFQKYGWFLDNHWSTIIYDKEVKPYYDNECTDCEYSENCNGQMCFFSMI